MSAVTSASLHRCNLCLVFSWRVYFFWSVFLTTAGIIYFFFPYQMAQPGVAKYILLYFQVRFKTVVIGNFWNKSWSNFPAFTADRCLFCLVRSPVSL